MNPPDNTRIYQTITKHTITYSTNNKPTTHPKGRTGQISPYGLNKKRSLRSQIPPYSPRCGIVQQAPKGLKSHPPNQISPPRVSRGGSSVAGKKSPLCRRIQPPDPPRPASREKRPPGRAGGLCLLAFVPRRGESSLRSHRAIARPPLAVRA